MQHLEVSCAVQRLYRSLGIRGLISFCFQILATICDVHMFLLCRDSHSARCMLSVMCSAAHTFVLWAACHLVLCFVHSVYILVIL